MSMRQIVLDTETTGLEPTQGHRIIEIGCVEMINRRLTGNTFQQYLNPQREIDEGALAVHGISNEMLADKPRFEDIVDDFIDYVRGAELIIHNAPFDVGFLNYELGMLGLPGITVHCTVQDTLEQARQRHPGQRNSLDALCKRYAIDNSRRQFHGALLDAEILADVYLAMTGGQVSLSLEGEAQGIGHRSVLSIQPVDGNRRPALKVVRASEAELAAHRARLDAIEQASGGTCLWKALETATSE